MTDRHEVKRTVGALFHVGVVAVVLGLALLHARFIAPEPYDLLRSSRFPWWTLVAGVAIVAGYGLGLPELPTRRRGAVVRAAGATAAAIAAVSMAQLAITVPLLPRSSLGLFVVVYPLWAVICWNAANDVHLWQRRRDRVFLVARRPEEHAALVYELTERPERPATLVGSIPVEDAGRGDESTALLDALEGTGVTLVVLDVEAQSNDAVVRQVASLHRDGIRVRSLALFYEEWLGKLPLGQLASVSLLFDIGELHRAGYVRVKRVIDVALGLVGSLALVLVGAIVIVGNRFGNRGSLLFSQERVGKDGRVFTMHKFRTMVPAGTTAGEWTSDDDPRITPFGRFLRRSHLDELPQMINVLRGELSIVGPRPEQPHYVDELGRKIPFYDVRHLVRPGLTGWAQIKQGYAAGEADTLEKLQYDVYYLRRQSLALDVSIIWRTVRGVITGDGR